MGIDADDIPIKRDSINTAFHEILGRRIRRRTLLAGMGCIGANLVLPVFADSPRPSPALAFAGLEHGLDDDLHVPPGYRYQVLLRWGDALFKDAPGYDPYKQSAQAQAMQFGYNNDFTAFMPLPHADNPSAAGLLVVNHEFVRSQMMHADSPDAFALTRQQIDTEILAHGVSVVAAYRQQRSWFIDVASPFNRRITPNTKMRFSGPASGHPRLKTSYAPDARQCIGTFANCAGCVTPWGTVLTAEENVQTFFIGQAKKTAEYKTYKRFGLRGDKTARAAWGRHHARWNLDKHPQAGLHAGWVVEIDPYDKNSMPIKRTALGRCKHEGCGMHINKDGRVVVYMGDDQVFEYIYRFVSKHSYQPGNRKQNLSLLDEGELCVAEFTDQGTLLWHPLVWGQGVHTKDNGFTSQADVVIDMRRAADLVGATPMDRPEEIKVSPVTGEVFAVLTNNIKRGPHNLNAANPRMYNRHGHILRLIAPSQDHSAREFYWEPFVLAGNPDNKFGHAQYHADISKDSWLSSPDNCSFDNHGNLWITTDGFYRLGKADGIWATAAPSKSKALTKRFLRAPREAEICSPCFTPDQKTMFCSVQHPGGDSSFDRPSTRWPDFDAQRPPRPAVIAITHDQDKEIGA